MCIHIVKCDLHFQSENIQFSQISLPTVGFCVLVDIVKENSNFLSNFLSWFIVCLYVCLQMANVQQ